MRVDYGASSDLVGIMRCLVTSEIIWAVPFISSLSQNPQALDPLDVGLQLITQPPYVPGLPF